MTSLVDSLERRGWVRRQRDPRNRRVVRLELTEAGAAKAAEVETRIHEGLVQCFAGLEANEVRELVALLRRLMPVDELGTVPT